MPWVRRAGGLRRVHRVITAGRRCSPAGRRTSRSCCGPLAGASGLAGALATGRARRGSGRRRADDAPTPCSPCSMPPPSSPSGCRGPPRGLRPPPGRRPRGRHPRHARWPAMRVALLYVGRGVRAGVDVVCVVGVQGGSGPTHACVALLGAADLVDAARGVPSIASPFAPASSMTRRGCSTSRSRALGTRWRSPRSAVRTCSHRPIYLDVVARVPSRGATHPDRGWTHPSALWPRGELPCQALVAPTPPNAPGPPTPSPLVRAGVPGADPANWWPLVEVSDTRARRAPGQEGAHPPSRLDRFAKRQLQWFLAGSGARARRWAPARVGSARPRDSP